MDVQALAEGLLGKWNVQFDSNQATLSVFRIRADQSMRELPIYFDAAWLEGSQERQDCTFEIWGSTASDVRWVLQAGGNRRYFGGRAFGDPPEIKMSGTFGSQTKTFGNWLALKELSSKKPLSESHSAASAYDTEPRAVADGNLHVLRNSAPPMWARLIFGAVILGGFYGLVAMAFFMTDDNGNRADAALKLASALGPLLGVVTGAMASFFFTEQERQASTERSRRLESQLGESAEARRSAEAATAVAMAMLNPDQRQEMLRVRDAALRSSSPNDTLTSESNIAS